MISSVAYYEVTRDGVTVLGSLVTVRYSAR